MLLPATRETAATISFLQDEEQQAGMDALENLLSGRMVAAFSKNLWGELLERAREPEAIVGALKIATRLARHWNFEGRDESLAALVGKGIELGWSPIGPTNGIVSACELLLALQPPLRGEAAARLCDALTRRLADARWQDLQDLLNAIALTAAHSTSLPDGGAGIADRLLASETEARRFGASPQWLGSLAMTSVVMAGPAQDRMRTVLEAQARAAPDIGGPEWYAVERAIAAGIDVGPDMGDRYLHAMTELLDALTAQVGSGSLGGGATDNRPLTGWAATNSSSEVRERAIAAAIRFLLVEGHLLREQRGWIPFIAVLARETPALLPQAVDALSRFARGEVSPGSGPFSEFTNPFAFMRVTGHTLVALRRIGLSWLGLLLPSLDDEGANQVVEVLEAAVKDSEPELRHMAATVARWALEEPDVSEHIRLQLKQRIVGPASKDHVEHVALAALRRPIDADENQGTA